MKSTEKDLTSNESLKERVLKIKETLEAHKKGNDEEIKELRNSLTIRESLHLKQEGAIEALDMVLNAFEATTSEEVEDF
jgi:hypothetical protein